MRFLAGFCAALLGFRPDAVMFGHALLAGLAPVALVLRPGAHRILVAHGIEVWGEPWRRIGRTEKRLVAWLVHRVASVSRYTASRMAAEYELDDNKFVLLPNAVDVSPGGPRTRVTPCRELRLLSVARMNRIDEEKGVGEVVQALPTILRRFPEVRYDVIGGGDCVERYRRLARELGVEKQVRFLGPVSDEEKDAAFRRASLFVLPSRKEGFGIVFLEAWNYALPVIGGKGDAAAEVITHADTGLLVDGRKPAEIAEAAIRLLSDPDYSNHLGMRGFERLRSTYSQENFRSNLASVLRCPHSRQMALQPARCHRQGEGSLRAAESRRGVRQLENPCGF